MVYRVLQLQWSVCLAVCACLGGAFGVDAQVTPGFRAIHIQSKVLHEDRVVDLYVPALGKAKCVVVYVFDPPTLFYPMVGLTQFLQHGSAVEQMPPACVVGVRTPQRDRDMPVPQTFLDSNDAHNFYRFLTEELVPAIRSEVPATGLNVLAGHSQGGLFVTYAALHSPALFQYTLALDAPMSVNGGLESQWMQRLHTVASESRCSWRYVSVEAIFGWNKDLSHDSGCEKVTRLRMTGETHQTMPYKGMYDGMKQLFSDHAPAQRDLTLPELQGYYAALGTKCGCEYPIPATVLLTSARENVGTAHKEAVIALLDAYAALYGDNEGVNELRSKAAAITRGPDVRVHDLLNGSAPSESDLEPFRGRWRGTLHVPDGEDMTLEWEIKRLGGKFAVVARVMDSFDSVSDFLHVDGKELVWGRKHDGGGLYVSRGVLSADRRTLRGTEDMIGFDWPAGVPVAPPNTFTFTKVDSAP